MCPLPIAHVGSSAVTDLKPAGRSFKIKVYKVQLKIQKRADLNRVESNGLATLQRNATRPPHCCGAHRPKFADNVRRLSYEVLSQEITKMT